MMSMLIQNMLSRPSLVFDYVQLLRFRSNRHKLALKCVENNVLMQYQLPGASKDQAIRLKEIVGQWIRQKPLPYLRNCVHDRTHDFWDILRQAGKIIVTYSDYHSEDKLKAMDLYPDWQYSSEQSEIQTLKPHPKGLNYICDTLELDKSKILFIGDRPELDGECARRADIRFLHLDQQLASDIYDELIQDLHAFIKA